MTFEPFTNYLLEIFWHLSASSLVVFIIISCVLFFFTKDRIYLLYAFYNFLLFSFILFKSSYLNEFHNEVMSGRFYSVNWFLQLVYHCLHIYFGLEFLNIKHEFPKFHKAIKKITSIEIVIGLTLFIFVSLIGIKIQYIYYRYFLYVHLPFYLLMAILILKKVFHKLDTIKISFFLGSVFYALFAIISMITTLLYRQYEFSIEPLVYFYIGILLETFFFVVGLGLRIRKVYLLKMNLQIEKNNLQKKLQIELEEKIVLKQKEYEFLQSQNEKEKLKNEVFEMQNKMLKNQMKSHFIFNVMNSIKANVIEKEKAESVKYINLFSKFIRKSFESSFEDLISLEEELKTLELYVLIEQKRLNDIFEFNIKVDEEIDISSIKLPSMILQPFVENAIWHGVLKNSSKGLINIHISKKNDIISIIIDDNGLGYVPNQNLNHNSKGIKVVSDRISIFNKRNDLFNIKFEIINKKEINNTISGTIVIFDLIRK
ncbi:MAG: histidine kinase [Flavobacteriaceae bacterium]|nr:histidine kinase [Flavobacteriaceae bacterium]